MHEHCNQDQNETKELEAKIRHLEESDSQKSTKIAELTQKVTEQQIEIQKQEELNREEVKKVVIKEELKEERKQQANKQEANQGDWNTLLSMFKVCLISVIFVVLQQSGRSQYE